MKFRAIIFDLDGTLLNTLDDLADTVNIILNKYSLPTHNVEAYKTFVGDGAFKLISRALPEENREDEFVKKLLVDFQSLYQERCLIKTRPYEGVEELLNSLNQKNIKLNVLSNKPNQFTVEIVKYYFNNVNFEIVWGEKPEFPRKPDPTSAIEIAKYLDIVPAEVLFIGDSVGDIKTAKSAGMYPAGVSWGYHNVDKLTEAGAKIIFNNPTEILDFIKN